MDDFKIEDLTLDENFDEDNKKEAEEETCSICEKQVEDMTSHDKQFHEAYNSMYQEEEKEQAKEFYVEIENKCSQCGKDIGEYETMADHMAEHGILLDPYVEEPTFEGGDAIMTETPLTIGESWHEIDQDEKLYIFETLGFKQGDALTLSGFQWRQLSNEVKEDIEDKFHTEDDATEDHITDEEKEENEAYESVYDLYLKERSKEINLAKEGVEEKDEEVDYVNGIVDKAEEDAEDNNEIDKERSNEDAEDNNEIDKLLRGGEIDIQDDNEFDDLLKED